MRYRITLTADAHMAASVVVEAGTESEAFEKAITWAETANPSWQQDGGVDGVTAESSEELE